MKFWSWKKQAQNSIKTLIWEGLGLYLGRVWDGLGPLLGTFGRFWAVFFGVLKSTFFKHVPAWAQDGLQEASGIDFGPIFHGFRDGLGGVWKGIWKNFEPLSK